jgi:hypothetical protein
MTVYRLSEFEYHHNDGLSTFQYDSLQDYLERQESVFILPILGDGHVIHGLIVRLVSSCQQRRGRMREEEEHDCELMYKRISIATTHDDIISDKIASAPKQSMVLI